MKRDKLLEVLRIFGAEKSIFNDFDYIVEHIAGHVGADKDEIKKIVTSQDVLDAVLNKYEEFFTEDELDTLIATFSGPDGQALLEKMPGFTNGIGDAAFEAVYKAAVRSMGGDPDALDVDNDADDNNDVDDDDADDDDGGNGAPQAN